MKGEEAFASCPQLLGFQQRMQEMDTYNLFFFHRHEEL